MVRASIGGCVSGSALLKKYEAYSREFIHVDSFAKRFYQSNHEKEALIRIYVDSGSQLENCVPITYGMELQIDPMNR